MTETFADVTYGNSAYAPLQGLRAQALSFDVPPQRHQTLGCNVDVGIGLESNRISRGPSSERECILVPRRCPALLLRRDVVVFAAS